MRGSAGGLEKLSAGVSGLVKKRLDCTVHAKCRFSYDAAHITVIEKLYADKCK